MVCITNVGSHEKTKLVQLPKHDVRRFRMACKLGLMKFYRNLVYLLKSRTIFKNHWNLGSLRIANEGRAFSRLLKNWGKGRRVCLRRRIGIFGVWQLALGPESLGQA